MNTVAIIAGHAIWSDINLFEDSELLQQKDII